MTQLPDVEKLTRWQRFLCLVMGWHRAPTSQGFDGCSFNGRCPRCGLRILQDSQGNWFTSSIQTDPRP